MRQLIIVVLFIFSINSSSQNLKCCKNIDEVKKAIQGDWKLKDGNENVIYRFSFEKQKGFIEVLEELNLPPKALETNDEDVIINEHTIFDVKSKNSLFFIDLISLHYEVSEQIYVLNENYFVYGRGQSEHVFKRDKG